MLRSPVSRSESFSDRAVDSLEAGSPNKTQLLQSREERLAFAVPLRHFQGTEDDLCVDVGAGDPEWVQMAEAGMKSLNLSDLT